MGMKQSAEKAFEKVCPQGFGTGTCLSKAANEHDSCKKHRQTEHQCRRKHFRYDRVKEKRLQWDEIGNQYRDEDSRVSPPNQEVRLEFHQEVRGYDQQEKPGDHDGVNNPGWSKQQGKSAEYLR